ncbi:MAG TPA: class I SAM-dependent methyltransferase [Candidatus Binatia bacterium]
MSASTSFEIPPPDPRLFELLGDEGFGDELFNERQHRSCAYVEIYVVQLAVRLITELGLASALEQPRTVHELARAQGFVDAFRAPLAWLLALLADAGVLEVGEETGNGTDAAAPTYRLAAPLPAVDPDAVRAAALEVDPSYAATYALLDRAAEAYARIARGEDNAEHALFQNVSLWIGYFNNANGYYAINNRVAAAAAAPCVGDGARVLEIGAGLGSATEALLERLGLRASAIASYRATEPVAFFRRRAERTLRARFPELALQADALDLERPWGEQGVAPGSYDLVWGVNVFHLARRLDDVLAEARTALAPGGALVVGEGMRPRPHAPVAAEMPFQLLAAYVGVETGPERSQPGFLTAAQWRAALERTGFAEVTLVPDVERMNAIRPGFYAAGVRGRRV